VRIRDLRFRYPGGERDVLRIHSLDIRGAGLIALSGLSGAGKTTLVELIAGTLRGPYDGSLKVLGQEWRELGRDADRQRLLRRIGLIPQDYGLLSGPTPRETILQDLADAGVPTHERSERAERSLGEVELYRLADRPIAQLSGGQRQRVAIARMLAREVEIVVADEPTANLDQTLTEQTVALLRSITSKAPVLIVTHDAHVAELCDRTIVLQGLTDEPPAIAPTASSAQPRRPPIAVLSSIALSLAVVAAAIFIFVGNGTHTRRAPKTAHSASHGEAVPPSTAAQAARRPSAVYLPVACARQETMPSAFIPQACADGGAGIKELTWREWGKATATGQGTAFANNCTPDCAAGSVYHAPAEVVVSRIRACPNHHLQYTHAAIIVNSSNIAARVAGRYSVPCPVEASATEAGEAIVERGSPSVTEIRHELEQMHAAERSAQQEQQRRPTPVSGGESIGGNGTIPIPGSVPEVVQKVIAGANEIADFPDVTGSGHTSFVDDAYDSSGSVSYALAAGGLLNAPETSSELESWGVAGPGRYITVYANAASAYMYVDGSLYDTAGRSGVYASRWQVGMVSNAGFTARHWPGL
jgi:ABC-type lipoprotein export system ATPase subunit